MQGGKWKTAMGMSSFCIINLTRSYYFFILFLFFFVLWLACLFILFFPLFTLLHSSFSSFLTASFSLSVSWGSILFSLFNCTRRVRGNILFLSSKAAGGRYSVQSPGWRLPVALKKGEEIGTLQMMAHLLATGGLITRSEEGLKDTPLPQSSHRPQQLL